MLTKLPLAKSENIIIQTVESELLIYDLAINKAYCLNETSAIIYQSCDGRMTFEELKNKHQFTDELIYLTLDELKKMKLIAGDYETKLKGVSRREAIRRIGLSSMTMLPVISSLIAPPPVQALSCVNPGGLPAGSPTTGSGTTQEEAINQTQSNCCSNNFQLFSAVLVIGNGGSSYLYMGVCT